MPVSRKRRISKNRPRRKGSPPLFEKAEGSVIRIKPQVFDRLRDNADFISLLRTARLTNALNYAGDCIIALAGEVKSPIERRTFARNLFSSGGFVYEGLLLVDSLYQAHHKEPYYEAFNQVRTHPNQARRRKIVQLMRDSAGFHLDHHDKSTRKSLKHLNLPFYDFVSGEDETLGALYFNIVDTVDINFVIDELKQAGDDETTIFTEIHTTITDLLRDLSVASEKFVMGISVKLKLVK